MIYKNIAMSPMRESGLQAPICFAYAFGNTFGVELSYKDLVALQAAHVAHVKSSAEGAMPQTYCDKWGVREEIFLLSSDFSPAAIAQALRTMTTPKHFLLRLDFEKISHCVGIILTVSDGQNIGVTWIDTFYKKQHCGSATDIQKKLFELEKELGQIISANCIGYPKK